MQLLCSVLLLCCTLVQVQARFYHRKAQAGVTVCGAERQACYDNATCDQCLRNVYDGPLPEPTGPALPANYTVTDYPVNETACAAWTDWYYGVSFGDKTCDYKDPAAPLGLLYYCKYDTYTQNAGLNCRGATGSPIPGRTQAPTARPTSPVPTPAPTPNPIPRPAVCLNETTACAADEECSKCEPKAVSGIAVPPLYPPYYTEDNITVSAVNATACAPYVAWFRNVSFYDTTCDYRNPNTTLGDLYYCRFDSYTQQAGLTCTNLATPGATAPPVATVAPTTAGPVTAAPTSALTAAATSVPTAAATSEPTDAATSRPTDAATSGPTDSSTSEPTSVATFERADAATSRPTATATDAEATSAPTEEATAPATRAATRAPTQLVTLLGTDPVAGGPQAGSRRLLKWL